MKKEKIILGIDPGTSIMGFGLVKQIGSNFEMIMMDDLIMNKIKDPYLKLQKIFQKTLAIIDHYHPDEVALEAPFFGKNVQSMLKLGRAQGVAMAAALQRDIPVTEYAPLKIKKSHYRPWCSIKRTSSRNAHANAKTKRNAKILRCYRWTSGSRLSWFTKWAND